MHYFRKYWRQAKANIDFAILNYGTRRFMILILATLALFDAFVPMTPNIFIMILAILQPSRKAFTVILFAFSAGISSFAFAIMLSQFTETAEMFGLQTFGEHWDTAQHFVSQYGPGLLIMLSIFPDIPRPSIAVIALSGVAPLWIGLMVFLGKLVLYTALVKLVEALPRYLSTYSASNWTFLQWLHTKANRFEAYRRRLKFVVERNERKNTQ